MSEKNSNEKRKIVVVQGRDIYEYRAFYQKFERAKYISHLDLYRAVQRTFQRADIPVWFTEGYNPHIYLTEKRTKKGMKTVDLKPMLFSSQAEAEGEALRLTLETACGVAENLSPVLLIDTFAAGNGFEADYRLIRRDGMYLEDGEAIC